MSEVISLSDVRERRVAEQHARALVMFECAASLARQAHPALMQLIEQSFGTEWINARVRETVTPRRRTDAPSIDASPRPARRG